MAQVVIPLQRQGFGETMRRDAWWGQPLLTLVVLGSFVVYATWAAFQGEHYNSARISRRSTRRSCSAMAACWFGPEAGLVAGLAALFAGAADPLGARRVPRYLLLLPRRVLQGVLGGPAVVRRRRAAEELSAARTRSRSSSRTSTGTFCISRCSSSCSRVGRVEGALVRRSATGRTEFGIGVGTLVLAVNVVLLGGYTFGCHSLRHLVGGRLDQLSKRPCAEAVRRA